MELLNVVTARSAWLFDIAELNPRGRDMTALIYWMREKYSFQQAPKSGTDVDDTRALAFKLGTFRQVHVADLKIYNDGVIATTISSTDDTDSFLEDALRSAATDFGLAYRPQTVARKLYQSELNVRSDKMLNLNPKLPEFAAKISKVYPSGNVQFDFAGVGFWPDLIFTPLANMPFVFERKNNTLPQDRKYFSKAPLETKKHLALLEEFEAEFMS
ncbi:MAG: hypothetical protein ACRD5W_04400 [Candidatus Acidiferrales bacterium]